MKEITRIHLASLPYSVELDAKKELESYIKQIRAALGADNDTMKEIESRIAELLAERGVKTEQVITAADVDAIKTQLGNPEDFSEEGKESVNAPRQVERRLMRDPANEIIAGVSSGLAAYLKIDPFWVRIGFVVLFFMTSGFMLVVYIIMAILMPEAKTAGERLQMAGKPVTLASLQDEAVAVAKVERDQRIVLTILRYFAGIGLLLVAAAALTGLAAATYVAYPEVFKRPPTTIALAFITGTTGLLFVLFCVLLAIMLLRNMWAKRYLVSLAAIAILGVIGVSSIALGTAMVSRDYDHMREQFKTKQTIDAAALKDAKKIRINAPGVDIAYHVQLGEPRAVVTYQKAENGKDVWKGAITKTADGAEIAIAHTDVFDCSHTGVCPAMTYDVTLDMYGPAVEAIEAPNGKLTYEGTGQSELLVAVSGIGQVVLSGSGMYDTLQVAASNEGRIEATNANVKTVKGSLADTAAAQFGTVKDADMRMPESCKESNTAEITFTHANNVKINGTIIDKQTDLPCARVLVSNNG